MFLSIKNLSIKNTEQEYKNRCWRYEVIDDDFEQSIWAYDCLDAVVKVYESRELDVPKNIIKFAQWWGRNQLAGEHLGFDYVINWICLYSIYEFKYIENLKKYLLLV